MVGQNTANSAKRNQNKIEKKVENNGMEKLKEQKKNIRSP